MNEVSETKKVEVPSEDGVGTLDFYYKWIQYLWIWSELSKLS